MKKAVAQLLFLLLPLFACQFQRLHSIRAMLIMLPNTYNPANRDVPIFVLTTGVSTSSNSLNYQLIPLLNADCGAVIRQSIGFFNK